MTYKREMRRFRAICSVLMLLLVSNLSVAGQMLMLPTPADSEIVNQLPPCHQAEQVTEAAEAGEAQETMPCCVDDCGNCLMSSILNQEQVWFADFEPSANRKIYRPTISDRNLDTLQRPPIFA